MRKFREVYKEMMEELPSYHLKAEDLQNANRGGSFRCRKTLFRGAAAAAVFLLCGVCTATAMNYHKSIIEVKENGVSITSEGAKTSEISSTIEAVPDMAKIAPRENSEESRVEDFVEEVVPIEYNSLEEFREEHSTVIAIPEPEWLGTEFENEEVTVIENHILVRFFGTKQSFYMSQQDNRNVEAYASACVFMGKSANERTFTNKQGLSYVMFDTIEDGEVVSIHAVISVNGRDLSLDFYGYEEEVVESVLDKLDLSLYFQEK